MAENIEVTQIEQGPAGVEVSVEVSKPASAQQMIEHLARRGIVLVSDGARLWSKTKGITPGVAAEIAPFEWEIIALLAPVDSK